jgi:hypothetical protein
VGEFLCCGGIIMNKLKKYWKKKSLVWKGGVIGAVFGLFVVILNLFFGIIIDSFLIREITGIIMAPPSFLLVAIFSKICTEDNILCLIVMVLFHPFVVLFYWLLGLLIGFIINLIRRKKK